MSKIRSNDEVIEEITKDLENQCIAGEAQAPSQQNIPESEDTENEIVNNALGNPASDDIEESANSAGCTPSEIAEDYIDEELLKEQEATLNKEELLERHQMSKEIKDRGNQEFKEQLYLESIQTYTEGLRICPLEQRNDRAILYCNRAASKFKLKRNDTAIDDCTKAIELNPTYQRAYLRRATAFEEKDKLDEALEDFKKLLELDPNCREAKEAVHRLPPLIQVRNEKLKDEMLGKLKDLGNMFLKPFGLSTNNFKMQQDPNTGGYSVNFQQ